MKRKLRFLLLCLLAISTLGFRTDLPKNTTIYVVRHAEKDQSDPKNLNPKLSPAGRERAEALAKKLNKNKLDGAFSTPYLRTKETAFLSAKNNQIEIQTYDAQNYQGITGIIKTNYIEKRVLIIGHSNTVLKLLAAFGAKCSIQEIKDEDYDYFFRITIHPNGNVSLKTLHYGKIQERGI